MAYDFNTAGPQQDFGDLIPAKTYAKVKMSIRFPEEDRVGDLPEFTRSKPPSTAQFLDCEFEIVSSPLQTRRVWQNIMIVNVSDKAMNISKAMLRAILESALGISPTDMSTLAIEARQVQSFSDFQGLEFAVRIDIEAGNNGFLDKNKIGTVVTPDQKEYAQIMAGTTVVGKATPPSQQKPASSSKPAAAGGWPMPGQAPPPAAHQKSSSPVPEWAR